MTFSRIGSKGVMRWTTFGLVGIMMNAGATQLLAQTGSPSPGLPGGGAQPAASLSRNSEQAESIRRAVVSFGVGRKIELRTTTGARFRGQIESIESDGFSLSRGRSRTNERLQYQEVVDVKPAGMPRWAHITLWTGLIAGAVILQWLNRAINAS